MIGLIPRYFFNFFFFLFIQVLILNKIEFSGYLNPYLYVLFVLTLPFEIPGWLLLLLASLLGLSVDVFSNTPGMHMAAILLMAFVRPYVLNRISPRDGYELGTLPLPAFYGFPWFFKYAAILVLIHHLAYFLLESFSFNDIIGTLAKIVLSSVFTLLIIGVTLLFNYQKRQRN